MGLTAISPAIDSVLGSLRLQQWVVSGDRGYC